MNNKILLLSIFKVPYEKRQKKLKEFSVNDFDWNDFEKIKNAKIVYITNGEEFFELKNIFKTYIEPTEFPIEVLPIFIIGFSRIIEDKENSILLQLEKMAEFYKN